MKFASRSDSQRFLKLTELSGVINRIKSALSDHKCASEDISTDLCLGRVAARDVTSEVDLPPITTSSMDGYALKSSALISASSSNPIEFKIRGAIYPSSKTNAQNSVVTRLANENDAYYVATGAPLPEGSDVVVRVEDTRLDRANNSVLVMRSFPKGKNVFKRGEDIREDELLIRRGRILSSSDIAMLIGVGRNRTEVFKIPRVGVLSVGNELRAFESNQIENNGDQRIVNNYFNLLSGYLVSLGAEPVALGIAGDSTEEIRSLIQGGVEMCDMVITIAGSSVGAKDFTPNAIESLEDFELVFHGVKVVPIRPAGLAMVQKKPVVFVPGHAISAALTFFVVALPILNVLSGLSFESRRCMLSAELTEEVANDRPIPSLYLAKVQKAKVRNGASSFAATPFKWGSNLISYLSRANGFVLLDANQRIASGEQVTVELFGSGELERIS